MRKLSACLMAGMLSVVSGSAIAHPERSGPLTPDTVEQVPSHARLGILAMSMTSELRSHFGAPMEQGVLVGKVEPGSPAARAGIKVGDVLVRVGGQAVDDASDVRAALATSKQSDKIQVELVRDKKTMTIEASLSRSQQSSIDSWLRDAFPWFYSFGNLPQRPSST